MSENITKADVVSFIEKMSVLELSQLIKELETKFGVSSAAPVFAGAAMPAAAGATAGPVEEKTDFAVHLVSSGEQKIQVIKVVRALTSLSLKDAKDLVDNAPKVLKEAVPKEEAEKMKKQLEEAGAKVELK